MTEIVILTFKNRELMDKTLDEYKKFNKRLSIKPNDKVYAFAYWLFRYSGLKISE